MAKGRGKKLKDRVQTISRPDGNKKMKKKKNKNKVPMVKATNAVPPAPVHLSDTPQALASAPATDGSRAASRGKEKAKDKQERLSGFIFMCNAHTKPECFGYRVFGLPPGKKEVVERIKAGTKLFLFDFDLKLLYGVYKAKGRGQLNLEPSAFGGKFPAQVRFTIYKDCLPLPESAFRRAIKDNYQGSKFRPELNSRQVRELLFLFRPCVASTAAPVPPMPEVAPPQAMLPSALEDQFQPSVRRPPPENMYLAGMQYDRGTERTTEHVYRTIDHQGLQALNDPYYLPGNQQMYVAEDTGKIVQDHYPRYRAVQQMVPGDRLVGLEREYHRLPLPREGELAVPQENNVAGYYYPGSGRPGLPERNFPTSSYHSFAGARQFYR
ncbi:hypothetical protein U1Q18_027135 [Sarracenia purpurea var. burkii]